MGLVIFFTPVGVMFRHVRPKEQSIVTALSAPAAAAALGEIATVFELPRLLLRSAQLLGIDAGAGGPVLVLPGFGASDASTAVLRGFLRRIGFDAHGWGLDRNHGDVMALLDPVRDAVLRLADRSDAPVQLVGWSLGGVLARETARDAPDAVRQVITFGTPVVGGPKYTQVGARYVRLGFDLDALEATVAERHRRPIAAPVTAIYSRADGIVAWRACIDPWTPDVEHVEVGSTHLGLGFDPDVYRIVAQRLARPRAPTRLSGAA
jgi:pimeloyl-ACP methyl ester carboxylesterase